MRCMLLRNWKRKKVLLLDQRTWASHNKIEDFFFFECMSKGKEIGILNKK